MLESKQTFKQGINLLIVNQHGSGPEEPATRSYDIGRVMISDGHHVTVIASSFSFYSREEKKLSSGQWWTEEYIDGVRFIWVRTFPYQKNDWRRVLNMFSFCFNAIRVGVLIKDRQDIIMAINPPPMAVLAGWITSLIHQARFWIEVKDLWPQTLVSMGALSEKSLITRGMRFFERYFFNRAEKILSLLPFSYEYIASLCINTSKVIWIPNGVDLERIKGLESYSGGSPDRLTVMYLGGHTASNELNTVLHAAVILRSQGVHNVRFIFVGDGVEKPSLMENARKLGLDNMSFRDKLPRSEVYPMMNEADAFIMSLKNVPTLHKYGISLNKMYDYLLSGRPIVLAGEPRNNPVKETGAGITVPPENPMAMAEAFKQLLTMPPHKRKAIGAKGMEYVIKNNDIRVLARKIEALF